MQQIRVYTADSGVSKPLSLLKTILNGFLEGRFLAYQLFVRDLKASVRQSFLGFFWHFIPAIATAVIWILLNSQNVISVGELPMSYPGFAITGTILWSLFTEAVNKPLFRFNSGKSMMVKLNFPREALLLAAIYDLLFSLLLKLIVLIPALLVLGYTPGIDWLYAVLGLLPLLFVGMTLGLLIVPLGMLYTDIGKGIVVIFQLMMYLSPVIFPFQEKGLMGLIHKYNPVSPYIEFVRSNFGGYDFLLSTEFLVWTIASLVMFIFGLVFLKLSLPAVLERSGA